MIDPRGMLSVYTHLQFKRALAALLLIAPATTGFTEEPPPGRVRYEQYGCFMCHGYQGQGNGPGGPRLAPTSWPYEAFAAQVRYPRGSMFFMPAFAPSVMPEADLRAIYEYIKSFEAPTAGQ